VSIGFVSSGFCEVGGVHSERDRPQWRDIMTGPPRDAVIRLSEADYRYGVGPLTIRVEHIDEAHPVHQDSETWLRVLGVEISWEGTLRQRRQILVRAAALRRALAEAGDAGKI
jgi:hypothetical protein